MNIKEKTKAVLKSLNSRTFAAALLIAFVLTSAYSLAGFDRKYEDIKNGVLRLHILAASDSEEDQALKLLVRDRVLKASEDVFSSCATVHEAKAAALENKDMLTAAANEVLKENGCPDTVSFALENTWFDEREYDGFTLPAGEYEALRMVIGEGNGHNWWCVMFPSVCIPAATDETGERFSAALGDSEADMVENHIKYKAKFKIVEVFESIKYKLKNRFANG